MRGDWAGAEQVYRKTILVFQERGHAPAVAHQLECMGFIAAHLNQYPRAARLLGAAQAIREDIQIDRLLAEQIEFSQNLAQLGKEMGEEECDRLMIEGAEMSLDEAVELALQ